MTAKQFSRISKAISDGKRYRILQRIAGDGELSCSDASRGLGITAATCSHHLKELHDAGLIYVRREGKFGYMRLRKSIWKQYLSQLGKLR
jgi:DNA-binding transcriptional ArsR family regulator